MTPIEHASMLVAIIESGQTPSNIALQLLATLMGGIATTSEMSPHDRLLYLLALLVRRVYADPSH